MENGYQWLNRFFPWLVEHACDLHNKYQVRGEGKTAYANLRGKPYTGEVYSFGTPVMHRVSGKWVAG